MAFQALSGNRPGNFRRTTVEDTGYYTVFASTPWGDKAPLVKFDNLIEGERRIYTSVAWPSLVLGNDLTVVGAKPLSEPMLEYC